VLVAAFDGDRVVGAATAAPMLHQKAEFRAPFEARGLDVARLFTSAKASCCLNTGATALATPSSTIARRRRGAAARMPPASRR
jgi:hypothetical protein